MPTIHVDFERFCETHPYRVVGPEKLPERRFRTLVCAAQTVVSEGSGRRFHVECGDFKASYLECRSIAQDWSATMQLDEARAKSGFWDKIGDAK
ncbi:MAG TPA: hypothetical protein VKF63_12855 [Terracidiphilus sp.]|nr:hypothetical protein [Terracidiphilus sp.]